MLDPPPSLLIVRIPPAECLCLSFSLKLSVTQTAVHSLAGNELNFVV